MVLSSAAEDAVKRFQNRSKTKFAIPFAVRIENEHEKLPQQLYSDSKIVQVYFSSATYKKKA